MDYGLFNVLDEYRCISVHKALVEGYIAVIIIPYQSPEMWRNDEETM